MTNDILLHLTESSPEPLRSQIARQLRERILSGDLPEGRELPSAHRLARERRVSPRVVRQALAALAEEGLLARDGDAVRVVAVSAEQRRALAQRRLLDDLRQQELSLRELELARDIQRRLLPPARVELNRRLCGELGKGQFVALAYARFSADASTVELANAGMPDPFVVPENGRPVPLEVPGPRLPLGIRAGVSYVSVTRPLAERARLLLFSDGIPEARRASGEPLGYDGLAGVVAGVAASAGAGRDAAGEWLDAVLYEVQRRTGPALDDDWTAVVVERRGDGQEAPAAAAGGGAAAGGEA
jgi:serine phosphatase RsbU (regulator of sigma subunit)